MSSRLETEVKRRAIHYLGTGVAESVGISERHLLEFVYYGNPPLDELQLRRLASRLGVAKEKSYEPV
jgi:hypothetical protein